MKKIFWTTSLIVYILLILFGALLPNPSSIKMFGSHIQYFHLIGFMILSLILLKTLDVFGFRRIFIITLIFGIAFSYITEILQLLVPTRSFTYADMLTDIVGIVIGMVIYRWTFYRR
jgi:VanZ family protein